MPYTAEISRNNPSCFLFLIDQSGSMSDQIGGINKKKADSVADAINRLLQNLIIKCAKSEGIRDYYEVGVIGYGAGVGPAFTGALAGRSLVPISEVADSPARVEERTKKVDDGAGGLVDQTVKFAVWFEPVADGGTPMCQALDQAHQLMQDWVYRHSDSYPPIVINITDGEATDGNPTTHAKDIAGLSTSDGNVLVFNCHITTREDNAIVFPNDSSALSDEYGKMLFGMSSRLPENLRQAARSEGFDLGEQARGFAYQADLRELIRFLDIGTRASNLR
jgi:hypothetical protein